MLDLNNRKEVLTEWVKALRSEKYKQGRGKLKSEYRFDNRWKTIIENKFCCLGVLCDLIDSNKWTQEGTSFSFDNEFYSLPENISSQLRLKAYENNLIRMNDDCYDFNHIADYIEETILRKNE